MSLVMCLCVCVSPACVPWHLYSLRVWETDRDQSHSHRSWTSGVWNESEGPTHSPPPAIHTHKQYVCVWDKGKKMEHFKEARNSLTLQLKFFATQIKEPHEDKYTFVKCCETLCWAMFCTSFIRLNASGPSKHHACILLWVMWENLNLLTDILDTDLVSPGFVMCSNVSYQGSSANRRRLKCLCTQLNRHAKARITWDPWLQLPRMSVVLQTTLWMDSTPDPSGIWIPLCELWVWLCQATVYVTFTTNHEWKIMSGEKGLTSHTLKKNK